MTLSKMLQRKMGKSLVPIPPQLAPLNQNLQLSSPNLLQQQQIAFPNQSKSTYITGNNNNDKNDPKTGINNSNNNDCTGIDTANNNNNSNDNGKIDLEHGMSNLKAKDHVIIISNENQLILKLLGKETKKFAENFNEKIKENKLNKRNEKFWYEQLKKFFNFSLITKNFIANYEGKKLVIIYCIYLTAISTTLRPIIIKLRQSDTVNEWLLDDYCLDGDAKNCRFILNSENTLKESDFLEISKYNDQFKKEIEDKIQDFFNKNGDIYYKTKLNKCLFKLSENAKKGKLQEFSENEYLKFKSRIKGLTWQIYIDKQNKQYKIEILIPLNNRYLASISLQDVKYLHQNDQHHTITIFVSDYRTIYSAFSNRILLPILMLPYEQCYFNEDDLQNSPNEKEEKKLQKNKKINNNNNNNNIAYNKILEDKIRLLENKNRILENRLKNIETQTRCHETQITTIQNKTQLNECRIITLEIITNWAATNLNK